MVRVLDRLRSDYAPRDYPGSAFEQALVKEQYTALRTQIPIIYLLVICALSGLQFATEGNLSFGINPPSVLALCAVFRVSQWMRRAGAEAAPANMWRRMRQTTWLTLVSCLAICGWCLVSAERSPELLIAILLFGGLAAIGASHGLSSYPPAARIPLLVVALPLAIAASFSDEAHFIAAAVSIAVVSLLLLRIIESSNRRLVNLVASKASAEYEHRNTDKALRIASTAASTDYLTRLANRRAFVSDLAGELDAARTGHGFCLALVDLDQFKSVNDSFGHSAGDELLRVLAGRLTSVVPDGALTARLGGDEFAVLLPQIDDVLQAHQLGRQIVQSLNGPAELDSCNVVISASCGLTLIEAGHNETTSSALKRADIALYQAKSEGVGRYAVFEPEMEAPRRRRAAIGRALQSTRAFEGLELVYQPIVDLRSGLVVALEALARWEHHDLGVIRPTEFIGAAEQLNLIGALSERLFDKAISEASEWSSHLKLAFNLSAVQLRESSFAKSLLEELERKKFPADRLQLEVTETAFLRDVEIGAANLQRLRSAGVEVVLDDFGAGYSSISYLQQIKFDVIKLDGSLLAGVGKDSERELLLTAVIRLCQSMRVPCIAEHVETEAQMNLLLELGCGLGQGHYLCRPLPGILARQILNINDASASS